jgi:DNA-binding CsgD family transcriptional regulator
MPGSAASARNREIVARLAAGATLRQVASEFGITWQRVSQIHRAMTGRPLAAYRPLWPRDRLRALVALQERGLSVPAIGERLGVSTNAVRGQLHRLRRS